MLIPPRPERTGLFLRGWILVLCLAGWVAASGQEVVLYLKNGDQVSGTIITEDTNRVMISTPWAKELVVPASEIVKRESRASEDAEPTTPAAPVPTPTPPPEPPPPAVKPKPAKRWFTDIQLGGNFVFGEKNQQVFTGRFKLTYAHKQLRNVIDYLCTYGKTDGDTSANRMDMNVKTDFDFAERYYVYNLLDAGYDVIRKIKVRYEAGPGVGYRWLRLEQFKANLEAGLTYQVQRLEDSPNTQKFYLRLAENATWSVSPRMTVDEKFEYFPNLGLEGGNYRFRFESNLSYVLINNVTLNFTVIDQYDTLRAPGVQKNDLQLRSSLGVKF